MTSQTMFKEKKNAALVAGEYENKKRKTTLVYKH